MVTSILWRKEHMEKYNIQDYDESGQLILATTLWLCKPCAEKLQREGYAVFRAGEYSDNKICHAAQAGECLSLQAA
jgi:hypothetical protein